MTVIAIDVEDDGALRPFGDGIVIANQLFEVWTRKDGRDPELSRLLYSEYLKTEHWRELRRVKLLRAGGECQLRPCGYDDFYRFYYDELRPDDDRPPVDVHHLTYARLGREWESDLIVLCRYCHAREHGKVWLP